MRERLQGHLAVEHRHLRHHLAAFEQLLYIQWLIVLHRKTLEAPVTVFIFVQVQLQAAQFDLGQADLTLHQAGPQVRHHLDLVQAQGAGAFAQLHVAHAQHRRKAAPAAFQGTDMHRHAQCGLGRLLHLGAVLGNQWHQLAAKADVQRHQHGKQGAQAKPPTGQDAQNADQTLHGKGSPCGPLTMARYAQFSSAG